MVKTKRKKKKKRDLKNNYLFFFPRTRIPVYCSNTDLANFLAENSRLFDLYCSSCFKDIVQSSILRTFLRRSLLYVCPG